MDPMGNLYAASFDLQLGEKRRSLVIILPLGETPGAVYSTDIA
jgi:hypothetical protein